ISVIAVVQFGLAMMPLCHLQSAALISGTTSGTASSMRNALELSTTTQPALTAMGANSFEMLPPALNSAISIPLKESFVSSVTVMSWPLNFNFLPAERADASKVSLPTGKFLFSRVLIISMPTAPVAPTTATCGLLRFINGRIKYQKTGARQCHHVGLDTAAPAGPLTSRGFRDIRFLTVDRENFTLYRRNQTQTLPCDFGPAIKL